MQIINSQTILYQITSKNICMQISTYQAGQLSDSAVKASNGLRINFNLNGLNKSAPQQFRMAL